MKADEKRYTNASCATSPIGETKKGSPCGRALSPCQKISESNPDQPNRDADETKNHWDERTARCDGQYDRLRDHNDRNAPANPEEGASQDHSQEFS
jgi:hypothetical protein